MDYDSCDRCQNAVSLSAGNALLHAHQLTRYFAVEASMSRYPASTQCGCCRLDCLQAQIIIDRAPNVREGLRWIGEFAPDRCAIDQLGRPLCNEPVRSIEIYTVIECVNSSFILATLCVVP